MTPQPPTEEGHGFGAQQQGMMDSSGSEFGSMLQQVSTLQGDLSKALGVCRDLRSENDVVVRNYEKVRASYSPTVVEEEATRSGRCICAVLC